MFQIGTVIQTKNASLPRNASFKLANISCTKATYLFDNLSQEWEPLGKELC